MVTGDRALARDEVLPVAAEAEWRPGAGFVVSAWLAFGIAHTAVRLVGNSQLGAADGLSMLAAQELNVAYQAGQPPLYDWTLWLIQQLIGPTALSAYLSKYAYMLAAGVFVYLGVAQAAGNRVTGVAASLSLMALFNVGITIHDQSTHSVAMIAALAATYYAFVMIAVRSAWRDYALLGVAVGLGILSKYGYALMPASFALAFLCSPALRWKILSWKSLLAIAIVLALVVPFLWWLLVHKGQLSARTSLALVRDVHGGHLQRAAVGIARLVGSLIVYVTPAVPILWAIWPQLLRRGASRAEVSAGALPAITGLAIAIALAASVLLVIASGVDIMRSRYMHVIGLLLPAYVVMYLKPEEFTRARVGVFLGVVLLLQAVPVAGRAFAPVLPMKPFCSGCSIIQPIDKLAGELERRGLGEAVILLEYESPRLGGNLRRYLPNASLRSDRTPTIGRDSARRYAGCITLSEIAKGRAGTARPTNTGNEVVTIAWPTGLYGPERQSSWTIRHMVASEPRCALQR